MACPRCGGRMEADNFWSFCTNKACGHASNCERDFSMGRVPLVPIDPDEDPDDVRYIQGDD